MKLLPIVQRKENHWYFSDTSWARYSGRTHVQWSSSAAPQSMLGRGGGICVLHWQLTNQDMPCHGAVVWGRHGRSKRAMMGGRGAPTQSTVWFWLPLPPAHPKEVGRQGKCCRPTYSAAFANPSQGWMVI